MNDEIIYILLAIGYVAYSFFKQWNKQKEAGRERKAMPGDEAQQPPAGDPKPATRSAPRLPRKDGAGKTVENIPLPLDSIGKEGESALRQRMAAKKPPPKTFMEEEETGSPEPFDLRKAVIYDAILNRPEF